MTALITKVTRGVSTMARVGSVDLGAVHPKANRSQPLNPSQPDLQPLNPRPSTSSPQP